MARYVPGALAVAVARDRRTIVLDGDVAEELGLRPPGAEEGQSCMRKGLDANILVYMLDNSDGRIHEKALEILVDLLRNPGKYAVTAQVPASVPLRG